VASFGDFIEDRFVLAVARSHIKRLHAAGSASRRRKCSESQLKVSASNTSRKSILLMLLSARLLIMSLAPVEAGEYYRDKTVRIVVGFAPAADSILIRAPLRAISVAISPEVLTLSSAICRAGSVIAANQLYHRTSADGLTIGNFLGSLALSQMLSLRESNSTPGDLLGLVYRSNKTALVSSLPLPHYGRG
jgi:hypothetical protein